MKTSQEVDFIIFSTADWDNPFWTNKQHISDRLAQRGHRVLYVESLGLRTPTLKAQDLSRIVKRIISFFKGARKVKKNVWVYSPLVIPLHRYSFIRKLNSFLLKTILKYYKWRLGLKNTITWTYNPIVLDLMESLNPQQKVYHSVDDLSAAPGMNSEMILNEEKKLLEKVDVTFCTSQKIFKHCENLAKNKVYYFSNVADYEHFSKARKDQSLPEDLKQLSGPIIGFVGAISEYKVDLDLIIKSALGNPHWQWVMIGKVGEGQPGTNIEELKQVENIHLLGPKKYEKLPQYLHYFDVCIIPTPVNDYTNSMFPMKFYEFMAAGKPIVARNIDSLKDLLEAHYSYSDLAEFQEAIETALSSGVKTVEICENLVLENTWEKRLDKMLSKLDSNLS